MADISIIERGLVGLVASYLFPGVTYLSGSFASCAAAGLPVKVYRGWPSANELDNDLTAGKAHVAVFPESGMVRLTSRYVPIWRQITDNAPTLTATVSGLTITLGGTVSAGQVIGVQYGRGTNISAFSYRALSSDTLPAIASALAADIDGATSISAQIMLPPTCVNPAVLVVSDQTASMEVRRQEQRFRISCFTPTPLARDAICSAVDGGIAGMLSDSGYPTQFFQFYYGTEGRIRYAGSYTDDKPSKDRLWRRDLCYSVEYPTLLSQLHPSILFAAMVANAGGALTNIGPIWPATEIFEDVNGNVIIDGAENLIGAQRLP